MGDASGLNIRRSVRNELYLPAKIAIAPEHRSLVRFAPSAGANGWIDADLLDFSPGGVGLITRVFVPRRCRIQIRVFDLADPSVQLLETTARVMRLVMTDGRPAYMLGTSFEDDDSHTSEGIERMMRIAEAGRAGPSQAA
ncbi:MAG: PilZ domain-containing protein [Phycisphaeraceae bacterium]|nr:PilZ domain-containing protein [Phycisphaeraceae bacterium]